MFQERLSYFESLSGSNNRKQKSKSLNYVSKAKTAVFKHLDKAVLENNSYKIVHTNFKAEIKGKPITNQHIKDKDAIQQRIIEDNVKFESSQLEPEAGIENQLANFAESLRRKRSGVSTLYNNKAIRTKETETGGEQNQQFEELRRQDELINNISCNQDNEDDNDDFGINDFAETTQCIVEAYKCVGKELVLTVFERKQKIVTPTKDLDQFCRSIDQLHVNNGNDYEGTPNIFSDKEESNEAGIEVEKEQRKWDSEEESEEKGEKSEETEEEKEAEEKKREGIEEKTQINETMQAVERNKSLLYNNRWKSLPAEKLEHLLSESDDLAVIKRHSLGNTGKFTERRSTLFSLDGNLVEMKDIASMESIFYEFSRSELIIDETILEENFEDVEVSTRYKNKVSRIKELVTTEKNYIAGLGTVVNDYMPHLKMNEPDGLQDKSTYIFGNIIEIYDGAKAFLECLQNCANDDVEGIANAFITCASTFDLYPEYAKNRTRADCYLSEFEQICETKQVELKDRRNLPGYLQTPILRLAQYVTLLHAMQKDLIKEIENTTQVTEAIELIKDVMKKGNDLITIDSIKHCPVNLTTKGSLIMGEKFSVLKPESYQAMVFLFEHIIVFTKISSKTTAEFCYVTSIDLTNLKVDRRQTDPVIFEVMDFFKSRDSGDTRKYIIEMRASSSRIKDLWTENIEKLLWKQLEEAKTHQNGIRLRDGT